MLCQPRLSPFVPNNDKHLKFCGHAEQQATNHSTTTNNKMRPRISAQRTLKFIYFNASPFATASSSQHKLRTLVTQAPSCLRERRSKLLESPVVDQVKRFPRRVSTELVGIEVISGVLSAC